MVRQATFHAAFSHCFLCWFFMLVILVVMIMPVVVRSCTALEDSTSWLAIFLCWFFVLLIVMSMPAVVRSCTALIGSTSWLSIKWSPPWLKMVSLFRLSSICLLFSIGIWYWVSLMWSEDTLLKVFNNRNVFINCS